MFTSALAVSGATASLPAASTLPPELVHVDLVQSMHSFLR